MRLRVRMNLTVILGLCAVVSVVNIQGVISQQYTQQQSPQQQYLPSQQQQQQYAPPQQQYQYSRTQHADHQQQKSEEEKQPNLERIQQQQQPNRGQQQQQQQNNRVQQQQQANRVQAQTQPSVQQKPPKPQNLMQQPPVIQHEEMEHKDSPESGLTSIFNGIEKFSLDMLKRLASVEENVVFSPMTTWTLLSMLSEGSRGTTLQELRRTLSLPEDNNLLHQGFGKIIEHVRKSTSGNTSQLELGNAVFTSTYRAVNPDFQSLAESYYNSTIEPLNFRNRTVASNRINAWVNELTHGHIDSIVHPDDLVNSDLVLASAIYFRGTWKDAFNASQTRSEPFFDEEGKKLGDVDMMYQAAKFRLSFIEQLGALALELPYASEQNSMLLLLPRRGSTVAEILDRIGNASQPLIADVLRQLREDEEANQDDEDIHVYLPRFALKSKQELSSLLKKMGIRALFTPGRNELDKLASQVYVGAMLHKAGISVTEEGTVAAAASAAILHNYSLPSTFKGNRPFLFLIVQKPTSTILFAGKVGNPATFS